ncbi:hypothetical protein ACERII_05100 [Evansella sp. AB-rgal1]|uniref:hypothetical protein n=1 Tax=Evansella sp. AB-rgal1 TaxID=3242696 RepID=UPI00359E283B
MKKSLIIVISAIILLVGTYTFIKFNPPLSAYSSGYAMDRKVLLVEIGNKSPIGNLKIEEILVNNNDSPLQLKVQVSHHMQGFVISDNFDREVESEYTFEDLETTVIQPNTDPQKQINKVKDGTATEEDIIYALSFIHEESINQVTIKYRHLGISHKKTLFMN